MDDKVVARSARGAPGTPHETAGPTPGPWHACVVDDGAFVILDGSGSLSLCSRAAWPHRAAESAANARLIAASPDLRDALERVWDAYGFDPSIDSSIWADVIAALAKAGLDVTKDRRAAPARTKGE